MTFNDTLKNILLVVFIVICSGLAVKCYLLSLQKNSAVYTAGTLAEGMTSKIDLLKNNVRITYRDKEKIIVKTIYVPSEGSVSITTPVSGTTPSTAGNTLTQSHFTVPGTSGTVVTVTRAGWTCKPGIGAIYDFTTTDLLGAFDVKFLYYRRSSATLFTTLQSGGLAVSYHIDQLFPENLAPANVEAAVYGGIGYNGGDMRLGVGLRTNF